MKGKLKRIFTFMMAIAVMVTSFTVFPGTEKTQPVQAATSTVPWHMKPEVVDKLIDFAKKQLNKPYVWGATGPNAFDCSGLVQYVFGHYNDGLPKEIYPNIQTYGGTSDLYASCFKSGSNGLLVSKNNSASMDKIKRGAILLFFANGATETSIKNGYAHPKHAGIYIGKGSDGYHYMIHAQDEKAGVCRVRLEDLGRTHGVNLSYSFLAFPKTYGNIKVKSLSGAWYGLYRSDGSYVKKVKAVNGTATFSKIEADDDYIIKQLAAPAGYKKNSTVIKIKQSEIQNRTKVISYGNSKLYGYIKVSVKSSNNGKGIINTYVRINHKYNGRWSYGTTVKTDKYGNAKLKVWLHPSYLYAARETKASDGFYLPTKTTQYVYAKTIKERTTKSFVFKNVPNYGTVQINSSSEDGVIAGAKYRIKHYNAATKQYSKGTVVTTDRNGKASLKVWLKKSYTYIITEEKIPENYVMNLLQTKLKAVEIDNCKNNSKMISFQYKEKLDDELTP